MTPQQIEYVLALAEEKNFSAAAKKLYISQPSFSQYIANLENQYNIKIFDRSTKPISLTQEGEAFVRAATRIQSIEKDFLQEIHDFNELKTGSLHIGASTFRTAHMLPQSIMTFSKKYPLIKLSIIEDDISQLFKLLTAGKIELIIGSSRDVPQDIEVTTLFNERIYVASSDAFLNSDEHQCLRLTAHDIIKRTERMIFIDNLSAKQLESLPFITCKDSEFGLRRLAGIFDGYDISNYDFEKKHYTLVHSLETAFSMTLAGLGVSIIPDTMIRFGNFNSHPFYYSLPETISESTINMYTRKKSHISKAACEYCGMLKELITIGTWRT